MHAGYLFRFPAWTTPYVHALSLPLTLRYHDDGNKQNRSRLYTRSTSNNDRRRRPKVRGMYSLFRVHRAVNLGLVLKREFRSAPRRSIIPSGPLCETGICNRIKCKYPRSVRKYEFSLELKKAGNGWPISICPPKPTIFYSEHNVILIRFRIIMTPLSLRCRLIILRSPNAI